MLNLGLPLIRAEHLERLDKDVGLAGAAAVAGTPGEAREPGRARRLMRGIGDGERMRLAAADLRRIRL